MSGSLLAGILALRDSAVAKLNSSRILLFSFILFIYIIYILFKIIVLLVWDKTITLKDSVKINDFSPIRLSIWES